MTYVRLSNRFLIICFALVATACGGGGAGPQLGGGGIGGTGLRIGPIETQGDVVVDGVDFDASAAAITLSGQSANAGDMQLGMIAIVQGTISGNAGTATTVAVEEVVKGEVEAIVDASTMTVQGQTVHVDENTVFGPGINPASLAGIVVTNLLEIYGFVKGPGTVLATRVERENALSELQLVGFVENHSLGAQTFTVGAQVVDYSGADTTDLPGGVPANGQLVKVEGLTALSPMNELVATEVKLEDNDELNDDADDAEVEGVVTQVVSPTEFFIGAQRVQTTAQTVFEGGTPADLVVGIRIDVDGVLMNGTLIADEVEFEEAIRIESDIATIVGNDITLEGFPGIVVTVDASTVFEGNAASFGDVQVGEHVEIRGRKTGASSVAAARVKEENADTDVELQGPVDAAPAPSDPTFSILGILIDTTGFQNDDFEGANDQVIGRAAFFAAIQAGTLVKVQGDLVGGNPIWDEVELEGEDD